MTRVAELGVDIRDSADYLDGRIGRAPREHRQNMSGWLCDYVNLGPENVCLAVARAEVTAQLK